MNKLRARVALNLGLLAMVMLLAYPVEAAEAARAAAELWANAFVPAMLPFFLVLPALTTPEACRVYELVLGRATEALFGCPGQAAGAVLVAQVAGSPAGAIALSRTAQAMTRGQLSRASILCSSLSPGFLVGAVGTQMLGSPAAGYILLRTQLMTTLCAGLLLKRAWAGDRTSGAGPDAPARPRAQPVRAAVVDMLTVAGYMVGFAVTARLISLALPRAGGLFIVPLEVTGGCAQLARSIANRDARLIAVSAACGLSGLSVMAQNAARLPLVPKARLALGKLMHAALSALFTYLQLLLPRAAVSDWPLSAFETALILASLLAIGAAALHRARTWFSRAHG